MRGARYNKTMVDLSIRDKWHCAASITRGTRDAVLLVWIGTQWSNFTRYPLYSLNYVRLEQNYVIHNGKQSLEDLSCVNPKKKYSFKIWTFFIRLVQSESREMEFEVNVNYRNYFYEFMWIFLLRFHLLWLRLYFYFCIRIRYFPITNYFLDTIPASFIQNETSFLWISNFIA